MTVRASTGLRSRLLDTGSLKTRLAGSVVRLYGGAVPATADDAVGSAVLLCTLSNGGAGVTFAAAAANGTLAKNAAESWSGTVQTGGTPTFFRIVQAGDADTASATAERLQGSIGAAGDLVLSAGALAATGPVTLDTFAVSLPT